MSEITKDDVVKFIEGMTVLELSALVKELEEKFGVSAAAPMMAPLLPLLLKSRLNSTPS
jgi:large subunit ribosomal protein L7/L12